MSLWGHQVSCLQRAEELYSSYQDLLKLETGISNQSYGDILADYYDNKAKLGLWRGIKELLDRYNDFLTKVGKIAEIDEGRPLEDIFEAYHDLQDGIDATTRLLYLEELVAELGEVNRDSEGDLNADFFSSIVSRCEQDNNSRRELCRLLSAKGEGVQSYREMLNNFADVFSVVGVSEGNSQQVEEKRGELLEELMVAIREVPGLSLSRAEVLGRALEEDSRFRRILQEDFSINIAKSVEDYRLCLTELNLAEGSQQSCALPKISLQNPSESSHPLTGIEEILHKRLNQSLSLLINKMDAARENAPSIDFQMGQSSHRLKESKEAQSAVDELDNLMSHLNQSSKFYSLLNIGRSNGNVEEFVSGLNQELASLCHTENVDPIKMLELTSSNEIKLNPKASLCLYDFIHNRPLIDQKIDFLTQTLEELDAHRERMEKSPSLELFKTQILAFSNCGENQWGPCENFGEEIVSSQLAHFVNGLEHVHTEIFRQSLQEGQAQSGGRVNNQRNEIQEINGMSSLRVDVSVDESIDDGRNLLGDRDLVENAGQRKREAKSYVTFEDPRFDPQIGKRWQSLASKNIVKGGRLTPRESKWSMLAKPLGRAAITLSGSFLKNREQRARTDYHLAQAKQMKFYQKLRERNLGNMTGAGYPWGFTQNLVPMNNVYAQHFGRFPAQGHYYSL